MGQNEGSEPKMIKNERVKLGAFCEGPAGLTKDLVSPQGTFLWIQKTQGLLQKASRWGVLVARIPKERKPDVG